MMIGKLGRGGKLSDWFEAGAISLRLCIERAIGSRRSAQRWLSKYVYFRDIALVPFPLKLPKKSFKKFDRILSIMFFITI
jgi:hypothetical protein